MVDLSNTTFYELDWHIQNTIIREGQKHYNVIQRDDKLFQLETIVNDENGSPDEKFCALIHRSLHNLRQEYYQSLAIFIALANSLLNPIIYAFWYPEFRQQLGKLLGYLQMKCILGFKDPLCLRSVRSKCYYSIYFEEAILLKCILIFSQIKQRR